MSTLIIPRHAAGKFTTETSAAGSDPYSPHVDLGELRKPAPRCVHLGDATGEQWPPADGLGDAIERKLSSVGITKERWAHLKHEASLGILPEGDCSGCEKRQRLLNWIGGKFGWGKGDAELQVIREVYQLEAGQRLAVFACGKHGQCVKSGSPTEAVAGAPIACTRCKRQELGYQVAGS